jgi:hypothetical protein
MSDAVEPGDVNVRQGLHLFLHRRLLQVPALALVLTVVGGISFYIKLCVIDNDIWWHLKVGDWIVEHIAVPHTGILSRTAAARPWVAYSWGYEVLMSFAYRWFGLIGIGLYGVALTIAVAYAVYWMLRSIAGRFWIALIVAAVTCSAFLFNGMPRPVFFSMVLFCVTLTLLFEANREGRVERLYWLPMAFFLWANLHIQFIYGLFLVGLLLATTAVQWLARRWSIAPTFLLPATLPALPLAGVFAACVLAACIGPNLYHPYVAVYEYSKAKFAYRVIIELQPLSFRGYSHYAELMLAGFGFLAVGWRKKIDLFKLTMLTVCTVVAFRTMRDAWFIAIPAAACIVDFPAPQEERERRENWMENAAVAGIVAVLLLLVAPNTDFTTRGLDRAISSEYPVNAVNFLRRNPQPGPIYNNLGWGGFLMWYMPDYPVAIDGRNDLYGDELDETFYATQNADTGYDRDPYLDESGVVLLDAGLPLAKILTIDPRFKLIYQDAQSVVYARR